MKNIYALHETAPMNAKGSLNLIDQLLDRLVGDSILQRDTILKSTTVFSDSHPPHKQSSAPSLSEIDRKLSDVTGQLLNYLNDIHMHVSIMLLRRTEQNQDFESLNGFSNDIDAIKQHLIEIPFDIASFYEKNDDALRSKRAVDDQSQFIRRNLIDGHKNWINYQVDFLKRSMNTVATLYRFVTKT